MKNIYSPRQIQLATFFGGPLTATYMLTKSFKDIGENKLAKQSLIISLVVSLLTLISLPFSPEKMPNNVLPLLYLVPVIIVLKSHYLTKEEIVDSQSFGFKSSWNVFGLSIVGIVVYLILAFGLLTVTQTSDDVAQGLVDHVNASKVEINPEYFSQLRAEKDPNGSGVFLIFTLNSKVVPNFEVTHDDVLREMSIQLVGKAFLTDLAEENVYTAIYFNDVTGKNIRTVILSPSNFI